MDLEELEYSLTAPSLTGHIQRLVTSNQPAEATRRIRFGKRRSRKRLMYSVVVVKTAVVVYHLLIRREVLLAIASLAECSALCRMWREGVRTCHRHTSQSRNHRCAACMLFWDLGWSLIFARKGRSSLGTPCQEEEVEKGSPPGCAEEKLVLLQHDFLHPCQVAPSGCLAS